MDELVKNCYTKAVLAAMIGESIVNMLPKGEGYQFSRKALDMCWKWVEKKDAAELWEINYMCNCLDSADGTDFLLYMDETENDTIKSVYIILIEIVAYIAAQAASEKNISLPQYLESFDEDEEYNKMLLDNMNCINKNFYHEMKISQIVNYCESRLKKNNDVIFNRKEMLEMFGI